MLAGPGALSAQERFRRADANADGGAIEVTGGDLIVEQSGQAPSFTNLGRITIAEGRAVTISGGTCTSEGTIEGEGDWNAPCPR